jgi:hypothetical protein
MGRAGPPIEMKISLLRRRIGPAWCGTGQFNTGWVEAVKVFDLERMGGPMSVRRLGGST